VDGERRDIMEAKSLSPNPRREYGVVPHRRGG